VRTAANILLPALLVVALALMIPWLVITIMWPSGGELGTARDDSYGENVTVTSAHPLGVRILSATVDPLGEPLDKIPVSLTLSTNLSPAEMWISAIRIEDGRPMSLEPLSSGSYSDAFPSTCLQAPCSRTYALVVCWRQPVAGTNTTVYFGGQLAAQRNAGVPRAKVALDRVGDRLDGDVATAVAKASGCAAGP
jgi:hypothetical protein